MKEFIYSRNAVYETLHARRRDALTILGLSFNLFLDKIPKKQNKANS